MRHTHLLLVVAATLPATVRAQGASTAVCPPPDSATVADWSSSPELGDPARPETGVIVIFNPQGLHPARPTDLVGRFRVRRVTYWRAHPPREDTTYFVLRAPTQREVDSTLRASQDTGMLAIGYLTATSPITTRRPEPQRIPLRARSFLPDGIFVEAGPAFGAMDADDLYEIWTLGPQGFRGWGPGGPSIVPEYLTWFCAERM